MFDDCGSNARSVVGSATSVVAAGDSYAPTTGLRRPGQKVGPAVDGEEEEREEGTADAGEGADEAETTSRGVKEGIGGRGAGGTRRR